MPWSTQGHWASGTQVWFLETSSRTIPAGHGFPGPVARRPPTTPPAFAASRPRATVPRPARCPSLGQVPVFGATHLPALPSGPMGWGASPSLPWGESGLAPTWSWVGASPLSLGEFRGVAGPRLPRPSGQKQPKVQKLEQVCCGLEQVLAQAAPHSWYTWLAGHGPTAAGRQGSETGRGGGCCPLPPAPPPPQSPSSSQSRFPALPPPSPGLTAEAGAPPAADGPAGHAAAARVLGQRGAGTVPPAPRRALGHVRLAAQHERLFGHAALGGHLGQQLGTSPGLARGPRGVTGVGAASHAGPRPCPTLGAGPPPRGSRAPRPDARALPVGRAAWRPAGCCRSRWGHPASGGRHRPAVPAVCLGRGWAGSAPRSGLQGLRARPPPTVLAQELVGRLAVEVPAQTAQLAPVPLLHQHLRAGGRSCQAPQDSPSRGAGPEPPTEPRLTAGLGTPAPRLLTSSPAGDCRGPT